jgi:hypothetical protein
MTTSVQTERPSSGEPRYDGGQGAHEAVLTRCTSNVRLGDLEVLERLGRLPDDVALTTDEAALFLRLSRTSLERMRRLGTGPDYVQGGAMGARGTNQKCSYRKGDLIDWQKANRVSNSMAAAVRRGQAYIPFASSSPWRPHSDLVAHRAFYVDEHGLLTSAVENTLLETVLARLGCWRIAWLNPVAAMELTWSDGAAYVDYSREIKLSLPISRKSITSALSS